MQIGKIVPPLRQRCHMRQLWSQALRSIQNCPAQRPRRLLWGRLRRQLLRR